MSHISLVGLEYGADRSVYSVIYGQFFNSFTAVALDSDSHLIYYTDVNRLLVLAYLRYLLRDVAVTFCDFSVNAAILWKCPPRNTTAPLSTPYTDRELSLSVAYTWPQTD